MWQSNYQKIPQLDVFYKMILNLKTSLAIYDKSESKEITWKEKRELKEQTKGSCNANPKHL